jgi:hypothetical protein
MNPPFPRMLPFRKLSGRRTSDPFAEKPLQVQQAIMWSPWAPWMLAAVRRNNNNANATRNRSMVTNGHTNGYTKTGSTISEERKLRNAYEIAAKWSWTTEFHGMGSLMNSRTKRGQMFWATVMISCLVVGGYSTYTLIDEYTSTPTATLITLQPVNSNSKSF